MFYWTNPSLYSVAASKKAKQIVEDQKLKKMVKSNKRILKIKKERQQCQLKLFCVCFFLQFSRHLWKLQAFPEFPRHFQKCLIPTIACKICTSDSAFLGTSTQDNLFINGMLQKMWILAFIVVRNYLSILAQTLKTTFLLMEC